MDSALKQILIENQDTEIGRKWNFKGMSTTDDYRREVPLTTYDYYKPYIDRMAERGEQNLLTSQIIDQFGPSSGTTGIMKLIPLIKNKITIPPTMVTEGAKKILMFAKVIQKHHVTPAGISICSISTTAIRRILQTYSNSYSAPFEAYDLDNPLDVGLYVQLVFGLKDTAVNELYAIFIPIMVSVIMVLKTKWRQMLTDIREGKIDLSLPISSDKRDILEAKLGDPDPSRADELQKIFEEAEKSDFRGFLSMIWPNLKTIKTLCSGNVASMIPTVKHYLQPHVHVSSFIYVCTEGDVLAVAAKPMQETSLFRLVPHVFFEFIPINDVKTDNPHTLLASELQVGQIYEIVFTVSSGFYRYRMGDHIKVIEQSESGPLIDFHGRGKMTLSLRNHDLYEINVEQAMEAIASTTSSRIDYIVSVDETTYSRYKIWIETSEDLRSDLDKFIDERLQNVDIIYKFGRDETTIDQLTVVKVKPGTFANIMEFMKSKTLNPEMQLKIPRMAITDEIKQILSKSLY